MRSSRGWLLLALFMILPACAQDSKPETTKKEVGQETPSSKEVKEGDRSETFKSLATDFGKKMQVAGKLAQKAKSQAEFDEILKSNGPNPKEYAEKGLAIVEKDPTDELSLDVLGWVVIQLNDPTEKGLGLLEKHHLKNPKLTMVLRYLIQGFDPKLKPFLEKVIKENKDKEALAMAHLALANSSFEELQEKSDAKKEAEVLKAFEMIEKDFGDVKLNGQVAISTMTKGILFELKNLSIGKTLPDTVEGLDLDKKKTSLKEYKGKVVVLDFWATWCPPCRAMIPHEREMVKKLEGKPFVFISISADDSPDEVKEFIKKEKMPWVHWWSPNDGLVREFNIRFFPTIFVLDANGVIRHKNIRDKELEKAVETLVAEAEKKK